MNKLTKGTIVGAAGIALLLGGAGTFALWSDSAGVDGGTINSGELNFESVAAGAWNDISPDVTGQPVLIPDIATFLIVPGDHLRYTQGVVLNAKGNNLLAEFSYDPTTILPNPLPTGITVTTSVLLGGAPVTGAIPVVDGGAYTVQIDVIFADVDDQVSQNVSVDLSALALTVTQVRPTP